MIFVGDFGMGFDGKCSIVDFDIGVEVSEFLVEN